MAEDFLDIQGGVFSLIYVAQSKFILCEIKGSNCTIHNDE